MNSDFCTKHNLSFCERGLRNSQQHFYHNKRQSHPVLGELLQRGGSGSGLCPLQASASRPVKWGQGGPRSQEPPPSEGGAGLLRNPHPQALSGASDADLWQSLSRLSRRGLRASQLLGKDRLAPLCSRVPVEPPLASGAEGGRGAWAPLPPCGLRALQHPLAPAPQARQHPLPQGSARHWPPYWGLGEAGREITQIVLKLASLPRSLGR